MPRFLIERLFNQRDVELGPRTSQKAMRLAAERFPGLRWEHSHVVDSDDDGNVRTFCIYEAPDEAALREHALGVGGHIVVNVYPLVGDVAPADIPPEGAPTSSRFF